MRSYRISTDFRVTVDCVIVLQDSLNITFIICFLIFLLFHSQRVRIYFAWFYIHTSFLWIISIIQCYKIDIKELSSRGIHPQNYQSDKIHFLKRIQLDYNFQYIMLIILLLIVLTSAQECPYCQYNACQTNDWNIGNCSSCNIGALVYLALGTQTFGICQQCPTGCSTCQYGTPGGPNNYPMVYCTSCAQYYNTDAYFGVCQACVSNCLTCNINVGCQTCQTGYALNEGNCLSTTTAAAQGNESTNNGLAIGLIIWGSVMTVASIAFLILWRNTKSSTVSEGLLNSEIEVGKIRS